VTNDLSPEERRRLRALAEQAAAEHSWQEKLNEPGTVGDIARYLQSLDNVIRDIDPISTKMNGEPSGMVGWTTTAGTTVSATRLTIGATSSVGGVLYWSMGSSSSRK